jgi:hypothetical protein
LAPSATIPLTWDAPMPRAPPVTIATVPCNLPNGWPPIL